jgi:mRNA-degrading endonuclease RelE of RelBE toxin-antitoxin system
MTQVGSGGIKFARYVFSSRFAKEFNKLDAKLQEIAEGKIEDLLISPFPPGLKFEKLKGYANPDVYTFHITGNYKVSLEVCDITLVIDGVEGVHKMARLRRIATHNEIDRRP